MKLKIMVIIGLFINQLSYATQECVIAQTTANCVLGLAITSLALKLGVSKLKAINVSSNLKKYDGLDNYKLILSKEERLNFIKQKIVDSVQAAQKITFVAATALSASFGITSGIICIVQKLLGL